MFEIVSAWGGILYALGIHKLRGVVNWNFRWTPHTPRDAPCRFSKYLIDHPLRAYWIARCLVGASVELMETVSWGYCCEFKMCLYLHLTGLRFWISPLGGSFSFKIENFWTLGIRKEWSQPYEKTFIFWHGGPRGAWNHKTTAFSFFNVSKLFYCLVSHRPLLRKWSFCGTALMFVLACRYLL